MPVIKIKRSSKKDKKYKKSKKTSAKRRKSVSSKPQTPTKIVNKMEKLLDKNEIKIDDSRRILKNNIDKIIKEINNDPNITKEKKTRIIFELLDIYSKTDIDLNNPEDYSKLNDLYRRFDNIIKQLDDISLSINEKRRRIYDLGLRTIRHSITIISLYYFKELFIYFIGLSILLSVPGPALRYTIQGISVSKFLYLVIKNLFELWYKLYGEFIIENVIPLLNDYLKVVFKTYGIILHNVLDFLPNIKNWLNYLYKYIVPVNYKSKFN
jgi:hypothetical protein